MFYWCILAPSAGADSTDPIERPIQNMAGYQWLLVEHGYLTCGWLSSIPLKRTWTSSCNRIYPIFQRSRIIMVYATVVSLVAVSNRHRTSARTSATVDHEILKHETSRSNLVTHKHYCSRTAVCLFLCSPRHLCVCKCDSLESQLLVLRLSVPVTARASASWGWLGMPDGVWMCLLMPLVTADTIHRNSRGVSIG